MPNDALLAVYQRRVFDRDGSASLAAFQRFEQNRAAIAAVANAMAGRKSVDESLDAILPVTSSNKRCRSQPRHFDSGGNFDLVN